MSNLNRLLNGLLMACILCIPVVHAHSPLVHSAPDNGETLQFSPAEIKLEFKKQVSLALIRIKGENIDKKLRPDLSIESKKHALLLPELNAGNYSAAWRAIGKDGHLMKGVIEFTIQP